MGPLDTLRRPLHDLRISVTDRCNFRCTYCMPKEVFGRDFAFLPKDQVLSFEEIERAARAFIALGVEKVRITGGEPLVRRDLPTLIRMLAGLRTRDGGELDLTLTTNGSALPAMARPLAEAGLRRVTTRCSGR
jgi:cyclic pyranopterin phosphate synthase